MAVTKSGTGTWDGDVGLGDSGTRGRGDVGTWGREDSGTWRRGDAGTRGRGDAGTQGRGYAGTRGLGEVGREDVGTRRRVGIRGRDKQITPDFCAEIGKIQFLTVYKCKIIEYAGEFVRRVADDFQRPWFLLAYFTVRALGTE